MKNKILNIVLLVGVILIAFFSLYQYLKYSQYSKYQIDESKIVDSSLFECWIENWEEKYDILKVNGWIIYKGEDIKTWKLSILIRNNENCYVVPMTLVDRTDVTEAFNDGFDYNSSGFSVVINNSYIEDDNTKYYILYENNDRDMIVEINGALEGN